MRADARAVSDGPLRYTPRLFELSECECCPTMEINPILNGIKDLSERTQTIRGYL